MPDDTVMADDIFRVLRERFHLENFRDGQLEIVQDVLARRDVLAVMPTGSGKSLCYQLPGLLLSGLVLVVTPLIALMKDQVDSLLRRRIRAASLNSVMPPHEQQAVCGDVVDGRVKFLFVAPERMHNAAFRALMARVSVGLLVIDEAHCISQWGHDFRPEYRRIGEFRRTLGAPTTIALTATAAPDIQDDIIAQLGLERPSRHILGFDRRNLRFAVTAFKTQKEKLEFARDYVRGWMQYRMGFCRPYPGVGILYASTVKQAEEVGAYLKQFGIRAGIYHARLAPAVRERVQEQFMRDEFHCLIATTAFGMGVDKPDIRYVLHLALSSSVEAYTQESGRAGRDRLPAECMLLFNYADVKIQESFIENASPDLDIYHAVVEAFARVSGSRHPKPGASLSLSALLDAAPKKDESKIRTAIRKMRASEYLEIGHDGTATWRASESQTQIARKLSIESRNQKKLAVRRLKSLTQYAYGDTCRTKFILEYFGSSEAKRIKACHHCDICNALPVLPEQGDATVPFPPEPLHFIVQKYLSTVARCLQAHAAATARRIAETLTGKTSDAVLAGLSTFRLLEYMDINEILVLTGVLREGFLICQFRDGNIQLTKDGHAALFAGSLADFPASVRHYLEMRFPDAACGAPWRPAAAPQ